MKTNEILLEDNEIFDLDKFKVDCSFILSKLKGTKGKNLLYRGLDYVHKKVAIVPFTERSGPRDSSVAFHNLANDVFEKKFGVKARNWLFATGNVNEALRVYAHGQLSNLSIIFPIGKFNWLCSLDDELTDLMTFRENIWFKLSREYNDTISENDLERKTDQEVARRLNLIKWEYNTKLLQCIKSKNEIHIKCESYYQIIVDSSIYDDILYPFLKTI